ncbi:MAG TPA: POTRA domain-containing protein, partial [Planctomycetota bacterium]|nr:POTRA domain-containing protein [Planctomycetota bacterium]
MRIAAAVLLAALCSATVHAQGTEVQKPVAPPTVPEPQAPAQKQELPIVRSIVVEGEQRYSEAQVISTVGQKIGEPYDPELVNRGLRTLWRSFSVKGKFSVRDVPTASGAPKEIELRIEVEESPSDRDPRFIGNIAIDTKTLKRWAQIEDRVELFEYQANRVRQRMLEGYRREGYYWAEVNIVKSDGSAASNLGGTPLIDLIFEIKEGPKVRVKNVEIRGNRSMPDDGFGFWKTGLSSFAKRQISEPSLFSWFGSIYVEETLDADLVAMRNVYRERGFLDAVVEAEAPQWNDDRSEVRLVIVIDEGEPYVVESLDVAFFEWFQDEQGGWRTRPAAGTPRFTSAELIAKLRAAEHEGLAPGKRYEETLLQRDETVLRELYGSEGHLAHKSLPLDMRWQFLDPELFRQPERHKIGVTYRIVESHPLTLREISFAGTHHTRDEVLRREVKVFPGGKADLKEINKGLSRIHGTGFFSDENAPDQHVDPTYRFIAVEGSKDLVDLEYAVEEG